MKNKSSEKERESFRLLRTWIYGLNMLNGEQKLRVLEAIIAFGLDEIEPTNLITSEEKLAWSLIKPGLKKGWDLYRNGLKGGAPVGNQNARKKWAEPEDEQEVPGQSPAGNPEPVSNQPQNMLERKSKFLQELNKFSGKYPQEMLNAFFYYWTEHNEGEQKMLFEYEKKGKFIMAARLKAWAEKEYNDPFP